MKFFSLFVLSTSVGFAAADLASQAVHGVLPGPPPPVRREVESRAGAADLSLQAVHGVLPGPPPAVRREVEPRTAVTCINDIILLVLLGPLQRAKALEYCSSFLGPQKTATVSQTTTVLQQTTFTTTVATTVIPAATSTITCAAQPTGVTTCGTEGYGYGANLIAQQAGLSPTECHTACLNNAACQSFQSESDGYNYCNLYSTPASGNFAAQAGVGYWFYDRDCQTYLPPVCLANTVTKRTLIIPPILVGLVSSKISSACRCVNTAPATVTSTQKFTVLTTQTNGVSITQTSINAASTASTTIYT